jgi:hypothetical protein
MIINIGIVLPSHCNGSARMVTGSNLAGKPRPLPRDRKVAEQENVVERLKLALYPAQDPRPQKPRIIDLHLRKRENDKL